MWAPWAVICESFKCLVSKQQVYVPWNTEIRRVIWFPIRILLLNKNSLLVPCFHNHYICIVMRKWVCIFPLNTERFWYDYCAVRPVQHNHTNPIVLVPGLKFSPSDQIAPVYNSFSIDLTLNLLTNMWYLNSGRPARVCSEVRLCLVCHLKTRTYLWKYARLLWEKLFQCKFRYVKNLQLNCLW